MAINSYPRVTVQGTGNVNNPQNGLGIMVWNTSTLRYELLTAQTFAGLATAANQANQATAANQTTMITALNSIITALNTVNTNLTTISGNQTSGNQKAIVTGSGGDAATLNGALNVNV
jgi:hypothetical protein